MALSPAEMREALARVAAWRMDPTAATACPRCGRGGLAITDHSARPHAEWYRLACAGCGLEETLHIPLASPGLGGHD